MQGGRSDSLRSDWLMGRGGGNGFCYYYFKSNSHPWSTSVSVLDKLQHRKIEVRLQKGFQGIAKRMGGTSQGTMGEGVWLLTQQYGK